jgi:thiosulfate dehydrogenase [quinone] large subunit
MYRSQSAQPDVSANTNDTAIAFVRIAVGLFFLILGQYKVFGTAFTLHGGFESDVTGMLHSGSTYPIMVPVIEKIILPHPHAIAFLVAYGEFLIGLSLIFGVLSRLASVFGLILMFLMWLSGGYPGPHVAFWQYWGASLDWSIFALCFIAMIFGRPEQLLSLSRVLRPVRRRR